MTQAEKEVILFLIYDGGADCCKKCDYLDTKNCCTYGGNENFNDDVCINGMIKHFEKVNAQPAVN